MIMPPLGTGTTSCIGGLYSHHSSSKGHFVPSKASWRTFLKAYMLNPTGNIPSPGPSSVSQPGSGAVTPLAR
jgi:hypothetical protein